VWFQNLRGAANWSETPNQITLNCQIHKERRGAMNNKQNPLNEVNKSRRKILIGGVGMVATIGLLIAPLST
jgi:hypothetical protein